MKTPQQVALIADPMDRVRTINAVIAEHDAAVAQLSRMRREALDKLIAAGFTQADLAFELDMSRSRISQLLAGKPAEAAQIDAIG